MVTLLIEPSLATGFGCANVFGIGEKSSGKSRFNQLRLDRQRRRIGTGRRSGGAADMRVEHLPCGAFVNASEELAFTHLRGKLQGELGDERFLVLTNVAHSVGASATADEIDLVVFGPTGVQVIDVKHWDRNYLRRNKWRVEEEADKHERNTKAR